jgi:hypothetical protein
MIHLRMRPAEAEFLRSRAAGLGLTLSDFLRMKMFDLALPTAAATSRPASAPASAPLASVGRGEADDLLDGI